MSPIRESERRRYPKDWRAISDRIKKRAGFRCECSGECGVKHAGKAGRCVEVHGRDAAYFRGKVILTTAHLDHTPENCGDENLKAMCQRCHLRYDAAHHTKNARATREAKRERVEPSLPFAS